MLCRMFSSCVIIQQGGKSQVFQYSHPSFMPNIWGRMQTVLFTGFFPLEITNSGDRPSALTHSLQADQSTWRFFRKGYSIQCHVAWLCVEWVAREYPSWHFGDEGPFPFPSDRPHVKKYFLSPPHPPLLLHLREQFSFRYFPSHMAWKTVLTEVIADFGDHLNERLCSNCLLNTNPSDTEQNSEYIK